MPPVEDGPGDWQRGAGAPAGGPRPHEPQQPGGPRGEGDPYGWSTAGTGPPRAQEPRPGEARPAPGWAGENASFWDDRPSDGAGAGGPPGDQPAGESRSWRRGPHRRRAQAGQQTGLVPSMQSALPSWLSEERVASSVPVRRLVSLSTACFAGLLGFALLAGAYTLPSSYAIVIFGVQVLFILAWVVAIRPPGARLIAGIGLGTAALADLAAAWPDQPSLAPLGYVTVAAFGAGVVGHLARGAKRANVTESLGNLLIVVVGVIAFASLVVLGRHPVGTQSIVVCLLAAGVALVVARLTDSVLPGPRTSAQVARGSFGVLLGAMAGTGSAALAGSMLVGISTSNAAVAGLVTAMAAIMADLAISYAEAGRRLAGAPPRLWVARHLQGPLAGFALAAPAAYVLSVMLLVPAL